MKNIFKEIAIIFLGILLILGGLQVIFHGSLDNPGASSGIYEFNGIERLMGLFPIIFGIGVVVACFDNLKKILKELKNKGEL